MMARSKSWSLANAKSFIGAGGKRDLEPIALFECLANQNRKFEVGV